MARARAVPVPADTEPRRVRMGPEEAWAPTARPGAQGWRAPAAPERPVRRVAARPGAVAVAAATSAGAAVEMRGTWAPAAAARVRASVPAARRSPVRLVRRAVPR